MLTPIVVARVFRTHRLPRQLRVSLRVGVAEKSSDIIDKVSPLKSHRGRQSQDQAVKRKSDLDLYIFPPRPSFFYASTRTVLIRAYVVIFLAESSKSDILLKQAVRCPSSFSVVPNASEQYLRRREGQGSPKRSKNPIACVLHCPQKKSFPVDNWKHL